MVQEAQIRRYQSCLILAPRHSERPPSGEAVFLSVLLRPGCRADLLTFAAAVEGNADITTLPCRRS
jgi:hypothetical protein